MNFKRVAGMITGLIVGNMIAERFVLSASPEGPGFVPVTDGLGMDEIARAGTQLATMWAADTLFRRVF